MTKQTYEHLIIEGIRGLPVEPLVEIVDFIYFVRNRSLQPQVFEEKLQNTLLNAELRQLSHDEEFHLEKEFENYDKLYPHE